MRKRGERRGLDTVVVVSLPPARVVLNLAVSVKLVAECPRAARHYNPEGSPCDPVETMSSE